MLIFYTPLKLKNYFTDVYQLLHDVEASMPLLTRAFTWRYGIPFQKVRAKSEGVKRS